MSLDDYKKVNPSEFDKPGNSLAGYSDNRTALKEYGGRTIKQCGVRVISCHCDIFFIKPIFHIVEAKGIIVLGLTTLRKMGIFQRHLRVFLEERNIHPVQMKSLARCESSRVEDVPNTKA